MTPLSVTSWVDLLAALSRETTRMATQVRSFESEVGALLCVVPQYSPVPALQHIDLIRQELEALSDLFTHLAVQMQTPSNPDFEAALGSLSLLSLTHALRTPSTTATGAHGNVDFF